MITFEFEASPWIHASPGAWCFISLPIEVSAEIRTHLKSEEEGWGRLRATAKIGTTEWKTAIWFDTKLKTYLLPVKAEVRKLENIEVGKSIRTYIWV